MKSLQISLLVLAATLFILAMSAFIVDEREYAIKLRLGQIEKADFEPGIYFRIPLIHEVKKFDKRLQTVYVDTEMLPTKELKYMLVDSFVKWRVKDALRFYVSARGDARRANDLLTPIIKNDIKEAVANATVQEAIATNRLAIMQMVQKSVNAKAENMGIEVTDVRIKRIDFPEEVREKVFVRMTKGREKVAREFRSKGRERAKIIRAGAERTSQELLAEAYREAETVRGNGDAKAAQIYAKAYKKDREFYRFYRSLQAYQASFDGKDNMLLISPDSEFFKYFNSSRGSGK